MKLKKGKSNIRETKKSLLHACKIEKLIGAEVSAGQTFTLLALFVHELGFKCKMQTDLLIAHIICPYLHQISFDFGKVIKSEKFSAN